MPRAESLRRGKLLIVGVLLLFVPVLILVATLAFLLIAEGLVLGELSVVELLELYVIELLLLAGGAYLLFRLLGYSIDTHLLDAPDGDGDAKRASEDGSTDEESVETE